LSVAQAIEQVHDLPTSASPVLGLQV
jgi:hypothetical protein